MTCLSILFNAEYISVQVVLGLLNSGLGGRVFLGLGEGGLVDGIVMSQQQRDECMLGAPPRDMLDLQLDLIYGIFGWITIHKIKL